MGQTISGSLVVQYKQTYTNTLDIEAVTSSLTKSITKSFTDGTGASKAQAAWTDIRSLATTTSEDIDLTALTNAFGDLAFTSVKLLIINVLTATTGYRLLVGGASSNAWSAFVDDPSDIVHIGAGSAFVITDWIDGLDVDSTHKVLKVENPSGGTVQYEIIVLGEGAVS